MKIGCLTQNSKNIGAFYDGDELPIGSGMDSKLIDKEVFIRKAFDIDPKKGMELLYRTYYLPLCSHASRFLYSKEVAEDIVGDIFFVFYNKGLYKDIYYSYQSYLFSAVRRNSFNYIRREFGKFKKDDIQGLEIDSQLPTPQQIMQYDELYFKIDAIIKLLPSQCRKVFMMSRYESKKYHEIASELNLSQKTVEAHISKALKILRESLNGEWLA